MKEINGQQLGFFFYFYFQVCPWAENYHTNWKAHLAPPVPSACSRPIPVKTEPFYPEDTRSLQGSAWLVPGWEIFEDLAPHSLPSNLSTEVGKSKNSRIFWEGVGRSKRSWHPTPNHGDVRICELKMVQGFQIWCWQHTDHTRPW